MPGIDIGGLLQTMTSTGEGLGSDLWTKMQTFALPELKKIAIQIEAIVEHITDYTPAGAKALFDMQVRASVGVIVAMTELTLLAVQDAINSILAAIKSTVNGALNFPLIV